MKKILVFTLLLSSIGMAGDIKTLFNNSNSNSESVARVDAALYQRYLTKWIEFFTLFALPSSFEVAKTKFLLPKDNPKYNQHKERLKNEVIDAMIRNVNAYGSSTQQNPQAQPNLQLYTDQAYLGLTTFGSSEVYQRYLAKQNDFMRDLDNIPANAIAEFEQNQKDAEEKYKCDESPTPAAEKACLDGKYSFLIGKNIKTAQKYFELLLPVTNRYVLAAKRVYDYYASLVRALRFPNDKAVKFAVESNAQTVFNLIVSVYLIDTCNEWYGKYLFERPE
ncbi:MAG: hypothetical protein FJ214_09565 [Ignavibacteria bacterium]|nr:hypothetical protein [Ignavibacteria bacterium]